MTRRKSRSIDWLHVLWVAFVVSTYAIAIALGVAAGMQIPYLIVILP